MQISYELLKKEAVSAKKNCQVWLYGQCTSGVGSCKMKLYLMFLLYVSKCYYHTDKPNLGRLVLGYFVLTFCLLLCLNIFRGNVLSLESIRNHLAKEAVPYSFQLP